METNANQTDGVGAEQQRVPPVQPEHAAVASTESQDSGVTPAEPENSAQVDPASQDAVVTAAPPDQPETVTVPAAPDVPPAESENALTQPSPDGDPGAAAAEPEAPSASDEPATPPAAGALKVDPEVLARTVEALLFAAEEPLSVRELARAASSDSPAMRQVLKALKARYDQEGRAWDLAEVAGGYRLVTRPEFFGPIQKLKTQAAQRKLTQAALETLALISYRQPIGRAEIESVRGVGAGPVLRQLLEKNLICITGRGTGLGQPLLYGTTDYFLEHFGLKSIQDLPKPGEFKS